MWSSPRGEPGVQHLLSSKSLCRFGSAATPTCMSGLGSTVNIVSSYPIAIARHGRTSYSTASPPVQQPPGDLPCKRCSCLPANVQLQQQQLLALPLPSQTCSCSLPCPSASRGFRVLSVGGDSTIVNRTFVCAELNHARINLITAQAEQTLVPSCAADLVRT